MKESIFKRKKTLIYKFIKESFCTTPITRLDAKTGSCYITIGNNKVVRISDHPKDTNDIQILINPFNNYYILKYDKCEVPLTFEQLKISLYFSIFNGLNNIGGTQTTKGELEVSRENNEAIKSGAITEHAVRSNKCQEFLYYITHEQFLNLKIEGKTFIKCIFGKKDYENAQCLYMTKAQYKTIKKYLNE